MSRKTYDIVVGISTAVATAASSLLALFSAPYLPAIIAGIGIVNGAIVEICSLFIKEEPTVTSNTKVLKL